MDKYSGKKLDSRYMIKEQIGVGGMAWVYKAHDIIDDREVAIKILKDEFSSDKSFIRRFKNESKAIAVLSHPNIVKIYDVSFGDRIQYIVMEYIDGITLKEYIESQKNISWKETLHFITQILRAFQHAHEKGVIHRDIKPQNIMLLADGTVKVTDFGIAKFAQSSTKTMTDKVVGSVHYIAPEQARGENTDAKADIYSVGVMMYELLTGKVPFNADNAVSVAIMQLQTNPVPLRKIKPNIPIGLEEITLKAMQKDPQKRYHSAAQMLTDIEKFRRNPDIEFEYDNEEPTDRSKYVDAINNINNTNRNQYSDSSEKNGNKKKKTGTKYAVIGSLCAAVLVGLVVMIMLISKSCSSNAEEVEVPNFIGMQYDEVIQAKEEGKYKFNFVKEEYEDDSKPTGEILNQNPTPSTGKKIRATAEIKLTVNTAGEEGVQVPDVKTLSQEDAISKIEALGLKAKVVEIEDSDTAEGIVKYSDPSANTTVEKGSTVTIYVSQGASSVTVTMPNLINETLETAKKKIESLGLKVGTVEEAESNQDEGIVIETDPLPTAQIETGSAVNLVVSKGRDEPITVDVDVMLPSSITDSVTFNVYVDGELEVSKVLVPAYTGSYTVSVTGSSGKSTVVVEIDGQKYYTYYVNFDKSGAVTSKSNSGFKYATTSSSSSSSSVSSTTYDDDDYSDYEDDENE